MADRMFSETFVPVGGKRGYPVLVSAGAHTLIIAAAIMVPVMASDVVMPPRYAMMTFRAAPPLPPPGGAPRTSPPHAQPSIPVVAPDGITTEEPMQATPASGADADLNAGIVDGGVTSGVIAAPPPPPAADQAPVRPGGDILPPAKVKDAAPAYPAIARAARVQGIVIVEATIGVNGTVQDARILRSIPLLDAAALEAVRQWEYTPTRLNNVPVPAIVTVIVSYARQ